MSTALKSGQARERDRVKHPEEYGRKVDITKVNLDVIKLWITNEIARILGSDDDIIMELAFSHLESAKKTTSKNPDIKQIQYELAQFLGEDTEPFCKQLWNLCLSAQTSPTGVPKELLEAKKLELLKEKEDEQKAQEAARQRQDREHDREQELGRIRERERDGRGRGRGRGGRQDFGGRRRSSPRRSPSPSRQREGNRSYRPSRAGIDSYQPRHRGHSGFNHGRKRPRSRSPYSARSRSPLPAKRGRRYSSFSGSSRSPPPSRGRHDSYRRVRSPPRRRRSPSYSDHSPPPKGRRRSRSSSAYSRSPPVKRRRDKTPSPRPPRRDLTSREHQSRLDASRLSRETTAFSGSSGS